MKAQVHTKRIDPKAPSATNPMRTYGNGKRTYTVASINFYPRRYFQIKADSITQVRKILIRDYNFKAPKQYEKAGLQLVDCVKVWNGPKPTPIPDNWWKYGYEGTLSYYRNGAYLWTVDGKRDGDTYLVDPNTGKLGSKTDEDHLDFNKLGEKSKKRYKRARAFAGAGELALNMLGNM